MKKLSFLLFFLLILTGLSTQIVLADKSSALEGKKRNSHSSVLKDNKHNGYSSALKRTSIGIHGLEKAQKRPDGTLVVTDKLSGNGTIHAKHVIMEGLLAPGNSPGCITVTGDYTFTSFSTLGIEIAGLTPCIEHDQLTVTGTLTIYDATFILVLSGIDPAPVYEPALGDTFKILDFGSITGTFGTIDTSGAVLPEPLVWDISQLYITGELIVSVQQYADGDLAPWDNPDGLINAADILIAAQLALGQRTAGALQYAHGDMNTDGIIDLADLLLIQQGVM